MQKAILAPTTPGPTCSALAKQRLDPMRSTFARDTPPINLHPQTAPWFGFCLHTSGRGVLSLAAHRSWTTTEAALWTYAQEWAGFTHYLIVENGDVYQLCDESMIAVHCGAKGWMRDQMLSGEWESHVSPVGLKHWKARWPGVKSPQHLFPGSSGNAAYLGAEMIPQPDATYTDEQYASASALASDCNRRHQMKIETNPKKLVGHEDLIPFDSADSGRWDHATGGWDPGYLRDNKNFDWSKIVISV